jgi:hypothetical protein
MKPADTCNQDNEANPVVQNCAARASARIYSGLARLAALKVPAMHGRALALLPAMGASYQYD